MWAAVFRWIRQHLFENDDLIADLARAIWNRVGPIIGGVTTVLAAASVTVAVYLDRYQSQLLLGFGFVLLAAFAYREYRRRQAAEAAALAAEQAVHRSLAAADQTAASAAQAHDDLRVKLDHEIKKLDVVMSSLAGLDDSLTAVETSSEEVGVILERLAREASETLSAVVGAQVTVCVKKLTRTRGANDTSAERLGIWPPRGGPHRFLLADSPAVARALSCDRLRPFVYIGDADDPDEGVQKHVQFSARTILIVPIKVGRRVNFGFIWASCEGPRAFRAAQLLGYLLMIARHVASIVTLRNYYNVLPPSPATRRLDGKEGNK